MAAKSAQVRKERKAKRIAALAVSTSWNINSESDLTKTQPATIARELESRSAQLKAIVSRDLLDKAVILHEKNPANGKDLSQHLASALTLVNAGDKLFGWSKQDQPRCLVQVGVMAQFAPKPEPETVTEAKP
jgi:hypothetical protein